MKSPRRRTKPVRRPAHRQRQKRYRVNVPRLLMSLLLILLVGEGALAVLTSPWFEVKKVIVQGRKLVAQEFVTKSTLVPKKSNIFTFPARTIADRLRPNPIIEKVTVSRRFPDALVVRITERKAYSVLSTRGEFYEVDAAGIPFRTVASPDPKLPVLSCDVPQGLVLGKSIKADSFLTATHCLRLARHLKEFSVGKITVDPNNNLCLNVRGGILIRLGQPQQLQDKLDKAQRTIKLVPDLEYVDVTCPGAPALKPKPTDANPS